jgi:hypothetical protein
LSIKFLPLSTSSIRALRIRCQRIFREEVTHSVIAQELRSFSELK